MLKLRRGLQPHDGGSDDDARLHDVALPMGIADDAAFAESAATGEDLVGTVGYELGQNQCRAPAEGRVAGRVGAVGAQ